MLSENDSKRIQSIIDVVMKVARGDNSVQAPMSDKYDQIDALAMGVNMMIDDLAVKEETDKENEHIKKLNAELEIAKQKAEESDRLKMAFLANMSHEIRTPMNGILGFADILKNNILSGEQQKEYIEIIEKSGNRLLDIINDIVDISRIEANIISPNITRVNINEQLDHLYLFFKQEAEEKQLSFLLNKGLAEEFASTYTDSGKLYAILTNLVKNAIKYTKAGIIEFGYTLTNGFGSPELKFYVSDTGIGIPSQEVNSVFDRFTRSKEVEKNALEGTGLGLAISKAYVELLHGKIWVESTKGSGSVFYFTLPYLNAEQVASSATVRPKTDEVKEKVDTFKVMVVEDDPTSEQLLKLLLQKLTTNLIFARNGKEAIELFKNNPDTSLILMDISLPVMTGDKAIKEIRKINTEVPIIAQTAFGLEGDRQKFIDVGATDYLKKPIIKDELTKMVKKYTRSVSVQG
ncbi:ATP-binding protein [uncultured Draconibacterium sp.]|uniref:ATP-binding response regulator n=1 Tax=uncultured Draconibacterium sp. TaxID=1573823 RepID=UPI00321794AF